MDDMRKCALDIAATSLRGAPFTEIVKAAEAFHAFLIGRLDPITAQPVPDKEWRPKGLKERLDQAQVAAVPPPVPSAAFGRQVNYDLAKADQSPSFAVMGGDPNVYEIGADNIPTRLVRRDDLPPDAA